MEKYEGFKIEDEVIIVEKQNQEHQGYVVNVEDKKQLDNALSWADTYEFVEDENGNRVLDEEETKRRGYTIYKREHKDGVVHKYKNGEFTLTLSESAERSSQGGKLSFWNCEIETIDNKKFLIGINTDLLIELLLQNTFIKGVCQSKIYLGRQNGRVGAFTENMQQFIQAKKDAVFRATKKTSNYSVGDMLINGKWVEVYLGEWNVNFDVFYRDDGLRNDDIVVIYTKPKTKYIYRQIWNNLKTPQEQIDEEYLCRYQFMQEKVLRVPTGESVKVDRERLMKNTQEYNKEWDKRNSNQFYSSNWLGYFTETKRKENLGIPYGTELKRIDSNELFNWKIKDNIDIKELEDYFTKNGIKWVENKVPKGYKAV